MVTGNNDYGSFGNGTQTRQFTFVPLYKNGDVNQPFINPINSNFSITNGAVVDANGKLWTSGGNNYGQLGNGAVSETNQMEFKIVESINEDPNYQVNDVIVGDHFIIIQIGNILYASGKAIFFGMTENITTFTKIPLPEDETIIKIYNAYGHIGVLMQSGNLYLNGDNINGQLGNGGTPGSWTTPVLTGVKDFALSAYQTVILTDNGNFISSGENGHGQLGLGSDGQDETGKNVNQFIFQTVPNLPSDIVSIQAGAYHSGFLTSTDELYLTGNDTLGEFGDGPKPSSRNTYVLTHSNVKYLDSGYHHTMIVTNDNKILLFGRNTSGELGNGTNKHINDAYSAEADRTYQFSSSLPISNPPATQIFLLIYFTM